LSLLWRAAVRWPRATLALAALLFLIVAPGVLRSSLRTDGGALVPRSDPRVLADREIRAEFGIEDPIVILVEAEGSRGIYTADTLALLRELTEGALELEGVSPVNVVSLATEKVDRLQGSGLRFRPVLDPLPVDEAELERTRDDVRAIGLYTGTLVSEDEGAAAVYVGVPAEADRDAFCRAVRELVSSTPPTAASVEVIGAPIAETLLGAHLLADLGLPAAWLGGVATTEPPWWRRLGLVPIALVLIGLVLWAGFQSWRLVLLAMTEVGACLAIVFGAMGWWGVPIYLTTAVLPVMLTVMGVADEVHLFACYRRLSRAAPERPRAEVVAATMGEMARPLVMTTVTTALGFSAFALSPIEPVRWFGIFAAAGILLFGLWSLTVLPAGLLLYGPTREIGRASSGVGRVLTAPLVALVAGAARWPRLAIGVVVAAVAAVALVGIGRLEVQDGWVRNFEASSAFHRATQRFNARFFGTHRLLVRWSTPDEVLTGSLAAEQLEHTGLSLPGDLVEDPARLVGARIDLRAGAEPWDLAGEAGVESGAQRLAEFIVEAERQGDRIAVRSTGKSGSLVGFLAMAHRKHAAFAISPHAFQDPAMLARLADFEEFLREQGDCAVGGVLGPVEYLSTAHFLQRGRAAGSRRVPEDPHELGRLWHNYGVIRGEGRRLQAVDPTYSRGLVSVFLENANFADTRELLERIRGYAARELAPRGVELDFAGDVAVSQALIEAIVSTQLRSVALCLVGIALFAALLGRSLRWGVLCVLPSSIAVVAVLAVMGVFGVPLGVATSMFAAMTLGVGVDYAIHLLERLRKNRRRGLAAREALIDAARVTVPAMAIDAGAVILGFGVLLGSQVPANARLGGVLVVSMGTCLAVTLLLLPALSIRNSNSTRHSD